MRRISLVLSVAVVTFAAVLAHAAPPTSAKPATAPAASPTPAAAPAPAAAISTPSAPAPAVTTSTPSTASFSDAQRTEVQAIIKDYLTKTNPEVLIEAMQELQKRQQADTDAKNKTALGANKDKLMSDPTSPIGGNPKGDVTVVEFFDYQCGYCKMTEPNVQKLLKEDKNVRFVYKDFPILGPLSVTAAKASLASIKQSKYVPFHDALMTQQQHLTEDGIYKTAKDVGIDVDKLKKDMNDDSIKKIVDANVQLGQDIGAHGTPTFVIADQVFPGALEYDQMKKAVEDARAAKAPAAAPNAPAAPPVPKKP